MSQQKQILELLSDYSWHCSSEFYALYMADPRKRLHELKLAGYILENRKCQKHDYHKGGSKEWKLLGHIENTITGKVPTTPFRLEEIRKTNDELALRI